LLELASQVHQLLLHILRPLSQDAKATAGTAGKQSRQHKDGQARMQLVPAAAPHPINPFHSRCQSHCGSRQ
jgi:hypothetical protein